MKSTLGRFRNRVTAQQPSLPACNDNDKSKNLHNDSRYTPDECVVAIDDGTPSTQELEQDAESVTSTVRAGHDGESSDQPPDDDELFDWEAELMSENGEADKHHHQPERSPPRWWAYLSPFMRRFLVALIGSLILIGVALCVHFALPAPTEFEMKQPGFINLRNNVQAWCWWLAYMWAVGWLMTFFVECIPRVVNYLAVRLKGRRNETLKSRLEYFVALKEYLKFLLVAAWMWGAWVFLIKGSFQSISMYQGEYAQQISNMWAAIFFTSAMLFVEKFIVHLIALRFHKVAFRSRIKENNYALWVLDRLSKSESRARHQTPALGTPFNMEPNGWARTESTRGRNSNELSRQVDLPSESETATPTKRPSKPIASNVLFTELNRRLQSIALATNPKNTQDGNARDNVDINSVQCAKKIAKRLFESLAGERSHVMVDDFYPYFATEDDARAAFLVFDKDGNDDISRHEMKYTVLAAYRERKALANSLRDLSQAVGKLDTIFLFIVSFIVLFGWFAIFNVDVWKLLVPLGSTLLALSFVFGPSAKSIFESIIFVFVTHPFDSGDMVVIDDMWLNVQSIGLVTTVFRRVDGQETYAPNSMLATKYIYNVRRSLNQSEVIEIQVDFQTENSKIHELRAHLRDWLDSNSRDFVPGNLEIQLKSVENSSRMTLSMGIEHRGNWQDLGRRWGRRTRFMYALKEIIDALGIVYTLPVQKVELLSPM